MDIKINKHIYYKKTVEEAFILAAGLGRRLMPLTKNMPKPLVEINQRPMIDFIFDALATIGINKMYINTHYQHERIFEYIERKKISNIHISHETSLLDTGGGIKNAIDPDTTQAIMIINCDAILLNNYSNLLQDLQKKFNPDKMDALLAFSSPKNALGYSGSGDYIIANDGTVIESDRSDKMVFMGISVLNTKTLELVNAERFSLVEIWSKLIKKRTCYGMVFENIWFHAGNVEAIKLANQFSK